MSDSKKIKKTVPSYRLHKASGRAVVTLLSPGQRRGRDVFLGRYGTDESRQRYAQVIAEWNATGHLRPAPTSDITIVELIDRYWAHVRSYYVKDAKPTSEQATVKQALAPLLRLHGLTLGHDFGPLAFKAVRQTMIEKNWSRNYINKQASRIKMLFGWASENELIPASIYHGLQSVKGLRKGRSEVRETAPVRPVPDADVYAIEKFVSPAVWVMIQLQLHTGARPGEICIMRTGDIETTGKVWLYRPQTHKTEHHDHRRIIHTGPRSQAVLKPWLRSNLQAYIFSPADEAAARMEGETSRRGLKLEDRSRAPADRYTAASYRRAIARACDRAFPHHEIHPKQIDLGAGKTRLEKSREFWARLSKDQRRELDT